MTTEAKDDPTDESDDELAAAQSRERAIVRAQALAERLARESRDDSWADAMEMSIQGAFESLDRQRFPTTQVLRSECRASLCVVDWEVTGSHEGAQSVNAIARSFGRSFVNGVNNPTTGTDRLTMYIARPGYGLATPSGERRD